ncbi:MAG: D-alanyl-D-alanine carboxypeptidase family protein [Thermoanaerobacteraceae bacterium]|nr:D-alanyl-D-alanine carboxypeptidase family protein [Thermoanaerobacteraceae bacterium]
MRLFIIIFLSTLLLFPNSNAYSENDLTTTAKSTIAIDFNSGRILYEKNSYVKLQMASTTKIMTAILAIENCDLNEYVYVGINPTLVGGSSIWLEPGERIKMEDLLYGLMLESGNDAAIAIAEHVSGNTKDFIELMNKKAVKIGAYDTHFANPHGLDIGIDDHYTTAYDLALITQYALKNPVFKKIVSTKYKTIPWENHNWNRQLKNHNKLLWLYDGVYGVKTGYTKKAGRCLVTASDKNGFDIIVVTLNCPDDWNDTIKILNYVYENYQQKTILRKGTVVKSIKVNNGFPDKVDLITGQDIKIPLKKDEKINTFVLSLDNIQAPIKEKDVLGLLYIEFNNGRLRIPLIAKQSINKENFVEKISNLLYNLKLEY